VALHHTHGGKRKRKRECNAMHCLTIYKQHITTFHHPLELYHVPAYHSHNILLGHLLRAVDHDRCDAVLLLLCVSDVHRGLGCIVFTAVADEAA